MDKLDRLGWASGASFVSHGLRLGIRVTDPEMLSLATDCLPPGTRGGRSSKVDELYSIVGSVDSSKKGGRRVRIVYRGIVPLLRTRSLDTALEALRLDAESEVSRRSPRYVFVHAGVVEWKGRAIVLPGLSHSGKTTMVLELVRQGARYMSDEFAIIDSRGNVLPYLRAPRVRGGEASLTPMRASAGGRFPIGLVVLTRFEKGRTWRPRARSAGRGILGLVENAVSARSRPELALKRLSLAARNARFVAGVRGEATEAAEGILAMADRFDLHNETLR